MNTLEYEKYQESQKHGDILFPYDTYICTIPLDFAQVPMHWHEEMEIIYIKKGHGIVSVNLTQFHVSERSVVLVLPGQLHSISQFNNYKMEYENIIFHPNILLSKQSDSCNKDYILPLLSGNIVIPNHFQEKTPCYREILSLLDGCDHVCEKKPEGYQLFIKSQLFMLFYYLANQCKLSTKKYDPNLKVIEKMKPVLKYVELHYAENITIETAAQIASYSSSHFMRCFKEAFHCSFIDYLKNYRLTMAARLLTTSNNTILSISNKVGFDNLSYFNRSFKEKYGVTPGKYRVSLGPGFSGS